jgi:iron uptake system component EfeO
MKKTLFSTAVALAVAFAIVIIQNHSALSSAPPRSTEMHSGISSMAQSAGYAAQVEEGLQYFRQLAETQLVLVEELQTALESGDVATAEAAYVKARPPYEQIEVFAASFEQEDTDIDARPYAFEDGETSSEFRGFHRIERLIFRDRNLDAAVPYAAQLADSVRSLIGKLNDFSNFSAELNFDGMITLATEVPAKKISGEEETWSDQSILIFRENWDGIYSQYQPFAPLLPAAAAAEMDAAYQACRDAIADFVTEGVAAAAPYSSMQMEDRRAVVQASYQLRDALVNARAALNL